MLFEMSRTNAALATNFGAGMVDPPAARSLARFMRRPLANQPSQNRRLPCGNLSSSPTPTMFSINAIEVRQNVGPLEHATADFYETVYPPNKSLWPDTPQCNPCDHQGNGIDFTDFHNHVLDSIPSDPGHGNFNPLSHVFLVLPADFSPAGQAAYAAKLPMKSEAAIDAAIAAGVAVKVDTSFYFLCAVVSANAVH
jgi:hypothetical protein